MNSSCVVILNPSSGVKAGIATNERDPRGTVTALMRRHGLGDQLRETTSPEDAIAATRHAVTAGVGLVVAAGGDGTVGVVARELLHTPTALGVLPLGSVMNIGRMLGYSRDLDVAAEQLATAWRAGHTTQIDVGRAGDHVFFEAGSVGFNAALFREANRVADGDARGLISTIREAFRFRQTKVTITTEDRRISTQALMVVVANGPYTGMGMTIAPHALLDDGLFDVRIFHRSSRVTILWKLIRVAMGRQGTGPRTLTIRAASVRVSGTTPLPCRADAEDLGETPIHFEVMPAALRVIGPMEPNE